MTFTDLNPSILQLIKWEFEISHLPDHTTRCHPNHSFDMIYSYKTYYDHMNVITL